MKNIVAGNWKSNKLMSEAVELTDALKSGIKSHQYTDIIIAPPAPYLAELARQTGEVIQIAAQNCSATESGAYTGEFTAAMLQSCAVNHVIIGHSERREGFAETDLVIEQKLMRALACDLRVLLCCGEPLEQRDSNTHFEWVERQLNAALAQVTRDDMAKVVIAYEPIWAIGTGKTASSAQAQEMHAFIRRLIHSKFGSEIAENTPILYGGSCKPDNALELFSQPDVNGGLIGGASLDSASFLAIVEASEISRENNG
jgi:triosephosphate isomerase (TIM)